MIDPYRLFSPVFRRMDPERAHRLAILGLKSGLTRLAYQPDGDDPMLAFFRFVDRTGSRGAKFKALFVHRVFFDRAYFDRRERSQANM